MSITLEQKLLKDRELQRGGYAAAFSAGHGPATARRLLEAPPQLAEKALRCLAAMAQTYVENVEQLISFWGWEIGFLVFECFFFVSFFVGSYYCSFWLKFFWKIPRKWNHVEGNGSPKRSITSACHV